MNEVVVAYVPVLHEGYRRFLDAHGAGRRIYLIGPELYADYRPLAKDIRALDAGHAAAAIAAWGIGSQVEVLDTADAERLGAETPAITLPAEDVSYRVVERFFARCAVIYDTVFLRWDKSRSAALREPSAESIAERVALAELIDDDAPAREPSSAAEPSQAAEPSSAEPPSATAELARAAEQAAAHSIDWWRQVGAALRLRDGTLLAGTNEHGPHRLSAYAAGDPRANFYRGVHLELSTATHAEAQLIARCAREGRATQGAVMYVTDFPCPPCAKLIAGAGIAKLYFRRGYAVLDGEDVLVAAGVEVLQVTGDATHE